MTIQKAIKSGKPFKVKWWTKTRQDNWVTVSDGGDLVWDDTGNEVVLIAESILSTDWEVKE